MDPTSEPLATNETWAGGRAARWAAQWEAMERQLAPAADLLLATAAPAPGERVLDVGCGTGATTRVAASAVGTGGAVVGVDVAAEMLDVARTVPIAGAAAPIDWVLADATGWDGPSGGFDLVLSRFGVMFFDDPATAFTNLHRLTAPGGRLCIATWERRTESALFDVPLAVVLERCAAWDLEPEVPDLDWAPCSLHPEACVDLLARTGWSDVQTRTHRVPLYPGGRVGPVAAAAASLESGIARLVADPLTEAQRDEIRASMAEVYAGHLDADGVVVLDGAVVVTTARP
jgi:SAM-dependent methyltransferase